MNNIKITKKNIEQFMKKLNINTQIVNKYLYLFHKNILKESFEYIYPIINFIYNLLDNNKYLDNKEIIKLLKSIKKEITKEYIDIKFNDKKNLIELIDNINKKYYILEIKNNKNFYYISKLLSIIKKQDLNDVINYMNYLKDKIDINDNTIYIKNKYEEIETYINKKIAELAKLKNDETDYVKVINDKEPIIFFDNEYILLKNVDLEYLIEEYKNFYNIFLVKETNDNNNLIYLLEKIAELIIDEKFFIPLKFVNQNLVNKIIINNEIKLKTLQKNKRTINKNL